MQHSSKGIAFLFTLLQYEGTNLNIITQHNCKKLIYIHMHACMHAHMHRGDIQIFLSVIFKLDEVIYLRRRTHTCIYFKENLNWCQVLEPALNSVPKLWVLEKA